MKEEKIISSRDLDDDIDRCLMQGYRIDMVMPSDAPREVVLSKGDKTIILRSKNRQHSSNVDWITGRAGMEYRDLIPDRLGGKVIASHIRLTKGGEVPDYVHYHKVDFQMIYCKRGRIRVVYEDQGPPFWLETGDCVLQPPEIRHRVLECTAGAEVIEVSMPAEHETWVEHEITLPTLKLKPDRLFGRQRFVRHVSSGKSDAFRRDTGIKTTTGGLADVFVLRLRSGEEFCAKNTKISFYFVLEGAVATAICGESEERFVVGDGFVTDTKKEYSITPVGIAELLAVMIS